MSRPEAAVFAELHGPRRLVLSVLAASPVAFAGDAVPLIDRRVRAPTSDCTDLR
jgi:hypothetical protein